MYSLCKHAFALIYGLITIGGLSQPEGSPLLLKELYSYPVILSKPSTHWNVSWHGIEFSQDEQLLLLRTEMCPLAIGTWNTYEKLTLQKSMYAPLLQAKLLGNYIGTNQSFEDELRIYNDTITVCVEAKNFDAPWWRQTSPKYLLAHRKGKIFVLGHEKSFFVIDSTNTQDAFEYKHPQHTIDAIDFIDNENILQALRYGDDNHPHTCIQVLDVKTKEETRFIKLPTTVLFNAIAATEDLLVAGHLHGITIWDRRTKALWGEIDRYYNCHSIALHPKNNTCAILHYQERLVTTGYEPHITTFLLPRISLFKKANMLTILNREKPTAQFHFS